jgi:SdrD B-like domain
LLLPEQITNGLSYENYTVDAGVIPLGVLNGWVWNDLDQDGTGNEAQGNLLDGYTLRLYEVVNNANQFVSETVTSGGPFAGITNYRFENLPLSKRYRMEIIIRPNDVLTLKDAQNNGIDFLDSDFDTVSRFTDILTPNGPYVDAGLFQTTSIGDQVWEDLNGNNLKDSNETGVNGVRVGLIDIATGQPANDINNQTIPATFTTTVGNEQGFYRFTNLRPGTYRVNFSNLPSNLTLVNKTGNLQDPNNSDVNNTAITNGIFTTDRITITAGQNIDYVDAGVRKIITPNRVLGLGNPGTGVVGNPEANYTNPKYIDGMTNVQKIVTNGLATIFLKQDGTVWATGSNKCGDLGNSEANFGLGDCNNGSSSVTRVQSTPIQITSLGNDNKDIDTFATLKNNGEVYAWGLGTLCDNNQSPVENGCASGVNLSQPKRVMFNGQALSNITRLNKGGMAIASNGVWYQYFRPNQINPDGTQKSPKDFNLTKTYQSPAPVNMTQVAKIYQLSWSTPVYTLMNDGTMYEGNTQSQTNVKDVSTNYINGQIPTNFNLFQTYVLKTDGSLWMKGYGLGGGTTPYQVVTDKDNNPLVNINSIGAELGVYAMDNNGKLYKELSGMKGLNSPDWYVPFVRPFITIADTNSNAVFLIDRPA